MVQVPALQVQKLVVYWNPFSEKLPEVMEIFTEDTIKPQRICSRQNQNVDYIH